MEKTSPSALQVESGHTETVSTNEGVNAEGFETGSDEIPATIAVTATMTNLVMFTRASPFFLAHRTTVLFGPHSARCAGETLGAPLPRSALPSGLCAATSEAASSWPATCTPVPSSGRSTHPCGPGYPCRHGRPRSPRDGPIPFSPFTSVRTRRSRYIVDLDPYAPAVATSNAIVVVGLNGFGWFCSKAVVTGMYGVSPPPPGSVTSSLPLLMSRRSAVFEAHRSLGRPPEPRSAPPLPCTRTESSPREPPHRSPPCRSPVRSHRRSAPSAFPRELPRRRHALETRSPLRTRPSRRTPSGSPRRSPSPPRTSSSRLLARPEPAGSSPARPEARPPVRAIRRPARPRRAHVPVVHREDHQILEVHHVVR